MDWTEVIALMGGVFVANMGVIIPLFLWIRSEANADRRDILQLIRDVQKEMKDFHGRLERQDAEFKHHLIHHHSEKR